MADQTTSPECVEDPRAAWISRFEQSDAGEYALRELDELCALHPESFDALRDRVLTDCYKAATFRDVLGTARGVEKKRLADLDRIVSLGKELEEALNRIPDVRVPLSVLSRRNKGHQRGEASALSSEFALGASLVDALCREVEKTRQRMLKRLRPPRKPPSGTSTTAPGYGELVDRQVGPLWYPKNVHGLTRLRDATRSGLLMVLTRSVRLWTATGTSPPPTGPEAMPDEGNPHYTIVAALAGATFPSDPNSAPFSDRRVEKHVAKMVKQGIKVAPWPVRRAIHPLFPDPATGEMPDPVYSTIDWK